MRYKNLLHTFFIVIVIMLTTGNAHSYHYKIHSLSAKLAAELVKKLDKANKRYAEIYQIPNIIQMGTGAWEEDNGNFAGNNRAMRHYYDPDCPEKKKGVPYYRHYWWWKVLMPGTEVTKPEGGRYPGALEWARNGAVSSWSRDNPFNWEGAIRAYDYTHSSRSEAYYRMGHVLHLLTDMAEPDHALNEPHPGSSYGIPDDLDFFIGDKLYEVILEDLKPMEMGVIKKAKISWLLYAASFRQLAMRGRALGYERLIDDCIHPKFVEEFFKGKHQSHLHKSETTRATLPPIQGKSLPNLHSIDDLFNSMADLSKKAVSDRNKYPIPLGVDLLQTYFSGATFIHFNEPIYLIPAINVKNGSERQKYYDLAWGLLDKATEHNARLLMHFYDIVNPPPYVKEVRVIQDGTVKYRAYWEDIHGIPEGTQNTKDPHLSYAIVNKREFKNPRNKGLMHDKKASIVIEFGPDFDVPERIDKGSVVVKIGGITVPGSIVDENTPNVWKGSFPVPKLEEYEDEKTKQISIAASDADMHWTMGPIPGSTLDSDPSSPAKVYCNGPGQYYWMNHESATANEKWDSHHKIKVVKEEVQPDFLIRIISVHKDETGMLDGQVWLQIKGDIEHLEFTEAERFYMNPKFPKETQRVHKIKKGDRIEVRYEYPHNRSANHVEYESSFWGYTSLRKDYRTALLFSWAIWPGEMRSLKITGIDEKGGIHVAEDIFRFGDWIPDPENEGLYKRGGTIK
jgi:hypothetical protein